jgi:HEAT repeat protein/putative zinc finger protein
MTCADVRNNLSLYLYGDLDFTSEEALETHLDGCESCRATLEQERSWHDAVSASSTEVPLDLLSRCREELRDTVSVIREEKQPQWIKWLDSLGFRGSSWSTRLATASLLICLGFGLSRLTDHYGLPLFHDGSTTEMSLVEPLRSRVRLIEPSEGNRVQLVVDEIREHVVSGTVNDDRVRQLLLAAAKDPTDPAIRVDSVELLNQQPGDDIHEALLDVVKHDPNPGVRLKALQGLGRFADDTSTRRAIVSLLQHDQSPDVRTQAIDLLLPSQAGSPLSPQMIDMLQSVVQSDPDDYVRMQCQRALHATNVSIDVY